MDHPRSNLPLLAAFFVQMSEYTEKLKHPKWQRKRLEIMGRADFKCEMCSDTESPLHVHHGFYVNGREPWQYPDESLHCVCEKCHKMLHLGLDRIQCAIGMLPIDMLIPLYEFLQTHPEFMQGGFAYVKFLEMDESNSIKEFLKSKELTTHSEEQRN